MIPDICCPQCSLDYGGACVDCEDCKALRAAPMPCAEGDRDGSISNDGSTPQRAALGRNEVAQVATARDASPARRGSGDAPAGGPTEAGHLLDERVTIGPDPDESKVTGYRIKGPWRLTREAAEHDALTLQEADEAHTHLVPSGPSSSLALLDALVTAAIKENERSVAQALRGERDPHTGALWETCFRHAFEKVLREAGQFTRSAKGGE